MNITNRQINSIFKFKTLISSSCAVGHTFPFVYKILPGKFSFRRSCFSPNFRKNEKCKIYLKKMRKTLLFYSKC